MPARARITLALTLLLLSSAAAVHAQCWTTTIVDDVSPVLVDDGANGYYQIWNEDFYTSLAHISSFGLSSSHAVPPGATNNAPNRPIMVSDRSGGAFTAVEGSVRRYSYNFSIGSFSWHWENQLVANGVNPRLTSDPAGDAYVAIRVPGTLASIKVARLALADGDPVWPPQIIQNPSHNLDPVRISHHAGNTFVLFRNFGDDKLWVQKFNSAGQPQWGTSGALVRDHDNDGLAARMIADNEGGCFVVYADRVVDPNGTDAYYVRRQRLSATGVRLWDGAPELAGVWRESGNYPGMLYLGLYANGDLLTCWTRTENIPPYDGDGRVFRARRSTGSGATYTEVWNGDFSFVSSTTGYSGNVFVSELDSFEGVSIVFGADAVGSQYNVWGRYLTQRGSISPNSYRMSDVAFSNASPRPYTLSKAGTVVGAWSKEGTQSTLDVCGKIVGPATFSGLTVIQGTVTAPACHSELFTVKVFDQGTTLLDQTVTDAAGKYELNVTAAQAAAGVRVSVQLPSTLQSNPAERNISSSSWLSNANFTLSYVAWTGGWGTTPVPVSTTLVDANFQRTVRASDGSLFVAWTENRCGNNDVFVQKFNNSGVPQWAPNGIVATTTAVNKYEPTLAVDGSGGVYVAFQSAAAASYDIIAQHIEADGDLLWGSAGLPICNATGGQHNAQAIADNAGGVLVAWADERSGLADVYAQRISSSGSVAWTANGVVVCNASGLQHHLTAVSDAAGGMVVTWEDERAGGTEIDAYAQRVLASGSMSWTSNGVALGSYVGQQDGVRAAADGAGGAFVVWVNNGDGNDDIIAQHITPNGTLAWGSSALMIHNGVDDHSPDLCADNASGIYVVWAKNSGNERVYAQRVNSLGQLMWGSAGAAVASGNGTQTQPVVSANPPGGIFIAWTDRRTVSPGVYAQRMSAGAALQWGVGGVLVDATTGLESDPRIITRTNGVAHVIWRRGTVADLYATVIESEGGGGGGCTKNCPTRSSRVGADTQLATGIISSYPNPFRSGIQIHFALQKTVEPEIGVFDVQGRQLVSERLAEHQPGAWQWMWNGENSEGQRADAGVYFVKVRLGPETFTRRVIKINH